ncbi:MAG: hypothetical protein H0V05_01880 [Euzebyaceae bacterium]|nr:hypothetical protein [Euzebyaceae bacterium]
MALEAHLVARGHHPDPGAVNSSAAAASCASRDPVTVRNRAVSCEHRWLNACSVDRQGTAARNAVIVAAVVAP